MRVKPRDIEINPDLPNYPFDNDLLDREEEIINLTNIIQNVEDPLVLAINAPWGTGKTTFINLWRAYLQKEKFKCICFNAWETDYAEDPLIPLVSEFDKWIREEKGYPTGEWNTHIKKLMPKIAKHAALTGVKIATYGLINIDSEEIKKMLADATGEMAGDLVEQFNEKSKANENFIKLIKESLKQLPENQNLVIFIDELDRCRPTYAIELLERIKHLFSVERLVFVLSTDTEQLSHSVRAVYGNDFDAKKYLKRFIDLDYFIKDPDLKIYIENKLKELEINDFYDLEVKEGEKKTRGKKDQELLLHSIFFFAKRLNLKLRDVNLLLTRILLILQSSSHNSFPFASIIPFVLTLLILRDHKKDLYRKYQLNPNEVKPIIEFLGQEISENEAISGNGDVKDKFIEIFVEISAYLIVLSNSNITNEQLLIDYCTVFTSSYPQDNSSSKNYFFSIDDQGFHKKIAEIKTSLSAILDTDTHYIMIQKIIEGIELFNRINIDF